MNCLICKIIWLASRPWGAGHCEHLLTEMYVIYMERDQYSRLIIEAVAQTTVTASMLVAAGKYNISISMQLLHWKLSAHNGINGWLITYGDPPEQIFWLDTANCGSGGPLLSREQLISGPHFDRLSNYFVIWQIASIYTPLIMVYFWLVRNKQKILLWFAQSQLSCMRVVTYDRYARRDKQFPFSLLQSRRCSHSVGQ